MKFPIHIPAAADLDAVGFGTNAVDHLICVPRYPDFNSKVELTAYEWTAGGEVASTMAGLRRLGLKTAYAGRFGDDEAGKLGIRSLTDEGVDMSYAEVVAGAETQLAFIVIDDRSGERTVIWRRDKKLAYSADDAPVEAASRCRVLHLTQHDTAAGIRMARAAKLSKTIVSIDIDNVVEGVDDLLPLVDVCIASAEFPQKLLGISDHKTALTELASRFGCAVTGLTLGEAGSLFLCGGSFFETPGFVVPGGCVDTTGAGDAFRTGFLYGMLTGESVEDSAVLANAVAALKCRSLGARAALPTSDEVKTMLKN
ncbi:sugar kinase [soil metagenome]